MEVAFGKHEKVTDLNIQTGCGPKIAPVWMNAAAAESFKAGDVSSINSSS